MITAGLVMALTIAGAVLAVSQRSMVRAIFGLALALGGVALAFLVLNSPFVAAMEVLIYIGGITVAMVFAVMLSSAGQGEPEGPIGRRVLAGLAAAAFFAAVAIVIVRDDPSGRLAAGARPAIPAEAWSVETIGRDLLDRFNVVFELLSVVLLLAIIGAITIASRHDEPAGPDETGGTGGTGGTGETAAAPEAGP